MLAATNRPWDLDDAVLRRLERRVHVPPPGPAGREALLRLSLEGTKHAMSDADVAALAAKAEGYSGADVANVCRDAASPGSEWRNPSGRELFPRRAAIGDARLEVWRGEAEACLRGFNARETMSEHHAAFPWRSRARAGQHPRQSDLARNTGQECGLSAGKWRGSQSVADLVGFGL